MPDPASIAVVTDVVADLQPQPGLAAHPPSAADDAPLRVLVVGSVGFVGDAIGDALAAADHVEIVGDVVGAPEAIDAALECRPEVVLLDADAAGDDWLELVQELAALKPAVTVVVLSWHDGTQVLDAIAAGARGYLTKDLSAAALARAVAGIRKGELAMSRKTAALVLHGLASRTAWQLSSAEIDPQLARLSAREREVLRLLATNMKDREIAEALSISVRTVESHVAQILRRLHVRGRAQAALRYASENAWHRRGEPPPG
jgi:DNA-binding NarL/FixJ family response regulator